MQLGSFPVSYFALGIGALHSITKSRPRLQSWGRVQLKSASRHNRTAGPFCCNVAMVGPRRPRPVEYLRRNRCAVLRQKTSVALPNHFGRVLNGVARLLEAACLLEDVRCRHFAEVVRSIRKQARTKRRPIVRLDGPRARL